ncbi:hypothetical protein BDP81DRAFT_499506 [Colletotrichum phormii]|uniref:Uncharacterized protein n=1 Tax=Colletotrichum phormii TaxID=359342 RepID=A0AAJ0ECX9_9PEZI|nr:uncharacterized protein BDP81DRAFT_499506 [Colletotrichum phormii]KAK1625128.1 hypothetical protein BDP81DRAFT_499506 [Colletotrichum phormii]
MAFGRSEATSKLTPKSPEAQKRLHNLDDIRGSIQPNQSLNSFKRVSIPASSQPCELYTIRIVYPRYSYIPLTPSNDMSYPPASRPIPNHSFFSNPTKNMSSQSSSARSRIPSLMIHANHLIPALPIPPSPSSPPPREPKPILLVSGAAILRGPVTAAPSTGISAATASSTKRYWPQLAVSRSPNRQGDTDTRAGSHGTPPHCVPWDAAGV